jgi:predicted Rossmann-fold nucleotide-binding protein
MIAFSILIYKSSFPSPPFYSTLTTTNNRRLSQMEVTSAFKIRNVCVFGGSSVGKEIEFLESANHLGVVLVECKIHSVYGGGSLGLMGCVSIAVFLERGY